jgi:benzoyl-CoA reductase/2-hydroxyglutaryl-CoA dehydratase subunit BcrC/BadD/HgdB
VGAGYFMPPQGYSEALTDWLSRLARDVELARRPRVLVLSSESLSGVHLHAALEASGALVVAEDDWWGTQAPGADISLGGAAKEAILQKYWFETPTSAVNPAERREAWFRVHAIRDDVDGVVFYLPPSDRQLGWDYPRLKAFLDHNHKASIRLRVDVADSRAGAIIQADIAAWLRSVPTPGGDP